MPTSDLTTRTAFLTQTIKDAGDIARSEFLNRVPGQFELKGPQDLVTASDHKVEAFLRDAITRAFPEDSFLGEETGLHDSTGTAGTWVVDPIDGTDNFARGIAHFCVAMAYVRDGKTVLGAIFAPVSGDLYIAQADHGATRDGKPMKVSQINTPDQAAVELGWSMRSERAVYMGVLTALLDQGCNVRRSGSGALALAMVADGRLDGYIELVMNAWDSIAGLLLVREAGGITCPDPAGRNLQTAGLVYAGNPYMVLDLTCKKAQTA